MNSLVQSIKTIHERAILYGLFLFFIPFLLGGIYLEKFWIGVIPFAILFIFIIFYHVRFLYWILIFSIACSVTFDFNKRLSTDFPTEFISIGLTAIFWILWLVYKPKQLNFLWNHKLTWGLAILWIWSFIASLQAVHFVISFKYILAKIWYITSFFILTFYMMRGFRDIKKLFWMLYIPILLTAIYSFVRTVLGDFSFEFTNQYSLPFYDNHVIYATTMTLILPLVYIARRWYPKGSLPRVLLSISILFLLITIYFSYTRACYLAILGGLTLVFLLKIKKLVLGYILAVMVIISVLFVFSYDYFYLRLAPDYNTTVMHDEFKDHLISTFYGKDASSMERLNMWISVFRMYQERPIAGYGPNNFPSTYKPYSVMYFKTWVSDNPLQLSCHNYFWLLLAEQGLVGLILFVIFIGLVLYYIRQVYDSSESPYIRSFMIALAAIVGIFIVILFFNDLIETSKNGSLFFIFLALLVRLQSLSKENEPEPNLFF